MSAAKREWDGEIDEGSYVIKGKFTLMDLARFPGPVGEIYRDIKPKIEYLHNNCTTTFELGAKLHKLLRNATDKIARAKHSPGTFIDAEINSFCILFPANLWPAAYT